MTWAMRFDGGEDLARRLDQLAHAVQRKTLVAALTEAAEPMRARAAQLAPRGPQSVFGHLADHIVIQSVTRVGSVQGGRWETRAGEPWVAVGPRKDFFYGLFQEFGTVHHGAQPFMRPAFQSGVPAALPILSQRLWQALRRVLPTSFHETSGTGGRLL
jgi:HK97 gp10 family phage protein